MAPAYNETIHDLIRRDSLRPTNNQDTSSSHSLRSAFPRCGLIVQYPSFLISEVRMIANTPFRDALWCLLPGRAEGMLWLLNVA